MNINVTRSIAATASVDVDDAVGVEKKHWFVAIVNHNSEKTPPHVLQNRAMNVSWPHRERHVCGGMASGPWWTAW